MAEVPFYKKTKVCKICSLKGSVPDEFYAGAGRTCKECYKEKVRSNRLDKVDYYRAYDAKRFREDPRVKDRNLRYQATEKGKLAMSKAKKDWQIRNPVKRAAHVILGNALKCGQIKKPDECSVCNKSGIRIHGHHKDYAKPLDVKWVCAPCHTKIHKGEI